MKNLKDKVAVITGGKSGVGYATAGVLNEKSAKVIITGKRKEAMEKAASAPKVSDLLADQSNIDLPVAKVKERFGKVDILDINTGITKFIGQSV